MNEKRKIIFKEALFTVPFLLIAAAVTFGVMIKSGRSALDLEQLITRKLTPDSSADVSPYIKEREKSYSVKYYYGDNEGSVLYADFVYESSADKPESTLTLYEARGGFDAGVYTLQWFAGEEYITYSPTDGGEIEKFLTSEVPLMYNFVSSYSWDGMLAANGIDSVPPKGYSLLGVKLFAWDFDDNGTMRDNFIWGIGGSPREMYSYIHGSEGEYKKAVLE